jgi:hypothetical protein
MESQTQTICHILSSLNAHPDDGLQKVPYAVVTVARGDRGVGQVAKDVVVLFITGLI